MLYLYRINDGNANAFFEHPLLLIAFPDGSHLSKNKFISTKATHLPILM